MAVAVHAAGGSDGGSCAGGPVVVMVAVTVAVCALVGSSNSITVSGICGNMIVAKEWMILPMAWLRREKK